MIANKVGTDNLKSLLNTKVGKNGLGTIDIALRCNIAMGPLLKEYGATEQAEAPQDWRRGRRAHVSTEDGSNARVAYSRDW